MLVILEFNQKNRVHQYYINRGVDTTTKFHHAIFNILIYRELHKKAINLLDARFLLETFSFRENSEESATIRNPDPVGPVTNRSFFLKIDLLVTRPTKA